MPDLAKKVNELESKVNTLKEDKDALKEQLEGSQRELEAVEPRIKENTAKPSTQGGATYAIGTGSRTTGDGTGTQSITGVGFEPSLIVIQASLDSDSDEITIGQATTVSNEHCVFLENTSSTYFIYVENSSGDATAAKLDSIDSDGFTLDWIVVNDNITFQYQCYK